MLFQLKRLIPWIILSTFLLSCSKPHGPKKEVDHYIQNVKIEKSHEKFPDSSLKQHSSSSPILTKIPIQKVNCKKQKCVLPNFPLNALSLVGIMSNIPNSLAFISAPSGAITTIQCGDIISSDYYTVTQISKLSITLRSAQSKIFTLSLPFYGF